MVVPNDIYSQRPCDGLHLMFSFSLSFLSDGLDLRLWFSSSSSSMVISQLLVLLRLVDFGLLGKKWHVGSLAYI